MGNNSRNFSFFQENLIKKLKKESFDELMSYPSKRIIETPINLKGWNIFILKNNGERGGVRIDVEGRRRFLLIFYEAYQMGFEMLEDGRVIEDDYSVDE